MAGINKRTVSELERGLHRPYEPTINKIREAFAPYVEFIEPVEGVRGAGIIMKWGIQPIGDASEEGADRGEGKPGRGLDARAWDEDFAEAAAPAPADPDFPPLEISDDIREEVREYLKTADISPSGRAVLVRDFRL